ncbi:hypothetical protein PSTG_19723, partial [Puccinia striiformis f. sp. tritici PST-78]
TTPSVTFCLIYRNRKVWAVHRRSRTTGDCDEPHANQKELGGKHGCSDENGGDMYDDGNGSERVEAGLGSSLVNTDYRNTNLPTVNLDANYLAIDQLKIKGTLKLDGQKSNPPV